jgi:hypothetical protein
MRLASPSLNSPSLALPKNQRSGGIGVKKGLMAVALAVSTTACEATKGGITVPFLKSSTGETIQLFGGHGDGARLLKNLLPPSTVSRPPSNTGNVVQDIANENNCDFTKAVLGTNKSFEQVLGKLGVNTDKKPPQEIIGTDLFKDLDLKTTTKRTQEQYEQMEAALARNPLAQQTTAQNPQQTMQDFRQKHDTSFNRALLAMNFPGARQRMAEEIVRAGLVEQAKGALNRLAETNPDLAEKGRQALKAAQTTASASLPAVPSSGWGQNVLALEERAIRSLTNNPNGSNSTIILNALGQFGLLNQADANGDQVARTFIEEIVPALGSEDISNQVALGIGRDFIPKTPLNQMTLEELRSALFHMNQNLFGADVTPRTNELLNQSGMTPLPGSYANGFVGSGN